jgi:hypothetical protein
VLPGQTGNAIAREATAGQSQESVAAAPLHASWDAPINPHAYQLVQKEPGTPHADAQLLSDDFFLFGRDLPNRCAIKAIPRSLIVHGQLSYGSER